MNLEQGPTEFITGYISQDHIIINNISGCSVSDILPLFTMLGADQGQSEAITTRNKAGDKEVVNADITKVKEL